jgi:hypothetical protein
MGKTPLKLVIITYFLRKMEHNLVWSPGGADTRQTGIFDAAHQIVSQT